MGKSGRMNRALWSFSLRGKKDWQWKISKITVRLLRWFFLLSLTPLILGGYISYWNHTELIKKEVINGLLVNAKNRAHEIESYIIEKEKDVTMLSRTPVLLKAMEDLTNAFEKYGIDSQEYSHIASRYTPFLRFHQEQYNLADLFLISSEGDAVFSIMQGEDLGSNYYTGFYKDSELAKVFDRARTLMETTVSDFEYYAATNTPAAFLATPVLKEGIVIGVIAVQISNEEVYSLAQDYTGLGQTGEIVVASRKDDKAYFLTPVRHDPYSAFRKRVHLGEEEGLPIQKAIQGKKGFGLSVDYRGRDVLAVWRYLPTVRWGMVVKMDIEEAFVPITRLMKGYLFSGFLTISILIMLALSISKSITNPIVDLTRKTQLIAKGDWEVKDTPTTNDEIGQLAHSFNNMVSARKQAEEALRESEEQYRVLFDSSRDAIMTLSPPSWHFTAGNPSTVEMFGCKDEKDFTSRTPYELSPEYQPDGMLSAEKAMQMIDAAMDTGSHFFEWTHKKVDGTEFHATVLLTRMEVRGKSLLQATVRDITERKQMEEGLIRIQRLHAAGELSAGVSHNLNNILSSVLGPAQLLTRMTDDPEILREVEDIISSGRRARDLVHRLHLSVRGIADDKLQSVSINEMTQEAIQTARPRWKDEPESKGIDIEMVTQLADVPPIQGTESRLHDILTNLIFNAVDAMPQGGTITINSQMIDDRVQISFSDTGIGMDEETKVRVFEPFFTTKMDIGTGLGLSTVYNAVTQWGGDINVESTPGEGTTFILQLPIWQEEELEKCEEREEHQVRPGKVLIIDDDKGICSMLSRLLGRTHEVETATDGRKALEQFVLGRYDAILIDLGMSGMSGDRVAKEIRQRDPLVSTVLITGWDLDEGDPRREPFDLQIAKPFDDLDEISDAVAQAIRLHDERVGGKD